MIPTEGVFGRWYLQHPDRRHLAWSGARWVTHRNGIPTGPWQVCNFNTQADARSYVLGNRPKLAPHLTQERSGGAR